MIKKLLLSTALIIMAIATYAQPTFSYSDFEAARKRAAREGKHLLVDVTTNSKFSPYINKVFKDKELSKYITDNFISVRINIDSKKGKSFGSKMLGLAAPSVIFYSNRGEQLEDSNWYFIHIGKDNLKEKALKSIERAAVKRENSREINFLDISFEKAVAKAKIEGKMLFVNSITRWSRPSFVMKDNIFNLDKVADYYNENYISITVDAERDSLFLARSNGATHYPSYLFFDSNGDIIGVESGLADADTFITYGKEAIETFNTNKEIVFRDITREEALKIGKPLFVYGYMQSFNKKVSPYVARYINENFTAISERKAIEVEHLLFLDSLGGEIHSYAAEYVDERALLEEAKRAVEGRGIRGYDEKFKSGERGYDFISSYLKMLKNGLYPSKAEAVAIEYLNALSVEEMVESDNFNILTRYVSDISSAPAVRFSENYQLFYNRNAKKADSYMVKLWETRGYEVMDNRSEYSEFKRQLKEAALSDEVRERIEIGLGLRRDPQESKPNIFTKFLDIIGL